MVLGLYYMTKGRKSEKGHPVKGEGITFYSAEEVIIAFNEKKIDLHAHIRVRANVKEEGKIVNKLIETTVGRVSL
jgi:DNA-directed RNA polymerase subunit beta'